MNILDKRFKYTPSALTDIRKTFARIRREQAEADKLRAADETERVVKVRKMRA